MTDNEITIKALKELLGLVLVEGCLQRAKTISNALDLINRQKAEIERLSVLAKLGNVRANDYRVMRNRALKAEKEVERLKKDSKRLKKVQMQLDDLCKMHHIIKAEAYKEVYLKLQREVLVRGEVDVEKFLKTLVGENDA